MATQNEAGSTEVTFEKPDPYTDIELLVEGESLYCNKTILSYASPVFAKMFHGEFTEKDQAKIPLPEKKYDDFRSFLLCIHPATLKEVTTENVEKVLPLANKYQVSHLKEKCDVVLEKIITDYSYKIYGYGAQDKLVHYLELARNFDLVKTNQKAVQVIASMSWKNNIKPSLEKAGIDDKVKLEILSRRMEDLESGKLKL
ncbi:uncharacterized protein LOC121374398 [Gigantopelta aegis]|uniref:uncharacterized protein LOC121374398 n=1 Tax=Gigantopelta aegis TaxID=1735272 RepID=UPI001B8873A1|nr:uncharacterized protein LOC121374398 [Gigantopelta aegis]